MATKIVITDRERQHLKDVSQKMGGVRALAAELGINEQTLLRVIADVEVKPGNAAILRIWLDRNPPPEPEASTEPAEAEVTS